MAADALAPCIARSSATMVFSHLYRIEKSRSSMMKAFNDQHKFTAEK